MASGRLQTTVEPALPASVPSLSFHCFPNLPVELRLRIWRYSFVPRCVEIHARRSHYADDFQHGGVPKWQSRCNNPVALSVSSEARSAALDFYPVKFPLATVAPYEHAGDSINDLNRVLYIKPAVDTVVVLSDLDYRRISRLFTDLRLGDPEGKGLQRLAVSASWTYHQGAGDTIRMLIKHMFPELVEMTVFMYDEKMPPTDWTGGVCALEDCSQTDYYKRYAMGRGQQMRDGDKWMVIGKKELRVMELTFRHGW
ncbi:uncharacterized protein BKA55DRAFT_526861 [Fusarium redolens]|uniref:2EXR domain-containing protein n=2 Tax=Fusarium TaxID=5506 RepID=A0A9P9G1K2_FUSRE|nr:uncharacterized protein BKA55DRAFT_526861 [Fusarium redolens]KAH7228471.1 hypothetical protein BKA55DRAFT_526861 [Fusarium redolens]